MLEKSRPRLQDQKKYQRRKDKRRRKKLQFIRLHTMLEGAHMLQEGGGRCQKQASPADNSATGREPQRGGEASSAARDDHRVQLLQATVSNAGATHLAQLGDGNGTWGRAMEDPRIHHRFREGA